MLDFLADSDIILASRGRLVRKIILGFLLICSFLAAAEITDFLGKTHVDVLNYYGPPNRIFSVRQSKVTEDDVVFNYEQSFMYFYASKLYRVLYSSEYQDKIYKELKIGDKRSKLISYFGRNYSLEQDGLIWRLDDFLVIARLNGKDRLTSLWFISKKEEL